MDRQTGTFRFFFSIAMLIEVIANATLVVSIEFSQYRFLMAKKNNGFEYSATIFVGKAGE